VAYGIILTIASVLLAIRFALVPQASLRTKFVVLAVEAASFLAPWVVVVTVSRLIVSLFVLLYVRWFSAR
jgi:hypothetical protein